MSTQHDDHTRAELEQRLGGLYHLLQRFEGLQDQKAAVFQRYSHLYSAFKKTWGAKMYWLWVLIGTAALTVVVFIAIVGTMSAWSAGQRNDPGSQPPVGVVGLLLTPLPVALVLAGVLVLVHNGRVPAANARVQARNENTARRITELAAPETAPLDAQLAQARSDYAAHYAEWFPERYRNSDDVRACWQIVHDGRATTLPDALNALVEDQHRQYMRDVAAAQLAEQRRATRVAQLNGVINATMQGAMIGTVVDQGRKTRAALNAPVTVRLRK